MKNKKKLTILHSNDMHGDFVAEKIDSKLVGGASMLSGYVNKVRSEEKNVIYAIAGDMFRGSIIDSEFRGLSTIEIMNLIAPDIATIGNHEIDYGVAHLLFIEKCAKFPIVNANLHIKAHGARLFKPYKIIERDGMKILFIGIITEDIMAQAKTDSLISSFIDTEEAARAVGRIINNYKSVDIDFTVLLTHIGFEEDKRLASLLDKDWGVDVIIGGHTHTFLTEPDKVNDILIVQAGTGMDQIGRFDIMVDTDNNCVDSYTWECIPIDDSHCPRDLQLEEIISKYKDQTDAKYSRIITRFPRQLTHPERNQETELGNLFADIFRESLGLDIMFLGSGSVRVKELGPIVDLGSLTETFPYDDSLYMIKLSGEQIKKAISHIFRDDFLEGHTEFYQLSDGLEVRYSKDKKVYYVGYNGVPINDDQIFSVGLQQYHFNNFEDFFGVSFNEVKLNGNPRVISTSCFDILLEYMDAHISLDSRIRGRIQIEV